MHVRDLVDYYLERVIVYEEITCGKYKDLYKGFLKDAPMHILSMNVKSILARRKDLLDIRVERE